MAIAAGGCLPVSLFAQQSRRPGSQDPALPAGLTKKGRAAIERGLEWLSRAQGDDGAFRERGGLTYPAAMTGLAGMALVASGSTPTRGRYWREVRRGVDFLLRAADPRTGLVSVPSEEPHTMYGHGFATLFLGSVRGMEEDRQTQEKLQLALRRAVALISAAQSPAGGWYYDPDSNSDEGSVTVTQVQALRACRMAGVLVDRATIDRAVDYVRRCQNADGSIRYSLSSAPTGRPAITAAAIAVLYSSGVYDDHEFVQRAYDYCKRTIRVRVDNTQHHYYSHYYWSQVMYHRGGKEWADYYAQLQEWLLDQQSADGSWIGDGVGPLYGTSVALTALQLPYALVPIYQR